MMETTAIMLKTPMMIPNKVRNVRSLFVHREPMAMETDSKILTLAIFLQACLILTFHYI